MYINICNKHQLCRLIEFQVFRKGHTMRSLEYPTDYRIDRKSNERKAQLHKLDATSNKVPNYTHISFCNGILLF